MKRGNKNWRFWTNISLYLGNDTRYGHSYNRRRMRSVEWCHCSPSDEFLGSDWLR